MSKKKKTLNTKIGT